MIVKYISLEHYLNVIQMGSLRFKVPTSAWAFRKDEYVRKACWWNCFARTRHSRVTHPHLSSRFQQNYKLLISLGMKMCEKVYNETLSIQTMCRFIFRCSLLAAKTLQSRCVCRVIKKQKDAQTHYLYRI